MAIIPQKEELSRLRKQFKRDLAKLREKYENLELAGISGIDPANLSSYGSGAKQPGIKVLKQFYSKFADEIPNPLIKPANMEENKDQPQDPNKEKKSTGNTHYGHDDDETRKTDEPATVPLYGDDASGRTNELIANLKIENHHHRTMEIKLMENGDKLFKIPGRVLDSIDKIVATQTIQAESHKMMLSALLQKFGLDKEP
jgi:Ribonuclease G/E